MYKIKSKLICVQKPIKNPSPDYRNINRIRETHSPVKQIKSYLTNNQNKSLII
jgi:hypothetical protein